MPNKGNLRPRRAYFAAILDNPRTVFALCIYVPLTRENYVLITREDWAKT